jgi:hypothetical protein
MTENGCVGNIATCGFYDKSSNDTVPVAPIVLMDELKPYFNNLRNCDSSAGCSAESRYKFLNGLATRNFNTNSSLSKSISVDGSYILFADYTGNCTYNSSKTNIEPLLYTCGWLGIDVNGNKGPNVGGRDFFGWYIVNTGQLIPFGISDDNLNRGCDPANTGTDWDDPGSGFGCTARVIKEDKINY